MPIEVTTGPMTIDLPDIVARARVFNWTPEQLVQSFNDMPLDVAEDLINGRSVMNQQGVVHPVR